MQTSSRVVVVGAGFGGLQAAQSLAGSGAEVVLIDRNNYHTFVPLLYQVATAQIEPEQIAYPVRTLLRRLPNVRFLMAEVNHIDLANQVVQTNRAAISYDFLVLATGSQTQFQTIPGVPDHAFALRTLEESVVLRNHIMSCFEQAVQEPDSLRRQQLLTFAIVGGGPTGVEMAGALVELFQDALFRDYPRLEHQHIKVILVQSSGRLLVGLPKKLGAYTYKRLRQIGVNVYLDAKVSRVTAGAVHLHNHQLIPTATVIWTAGLEAAPPDASDELSHATKGKLVVQPTLQVAERSQVYAIGDVAYVEQDGKPLVGVAPEALQQGVAVARNIKRQLQGKAPKPFRYFNKGRLAIIGCYSGVGKIGAIAFTGFLAWIMWLGVHLVYLPGYRSRLMVLLNWLYTYGVGDRAIRSIMPLATSVETRKGSRNKAVRYSSGSR
ncbi:NAD(P)/FAD-dependent oxidoreductase [Oculatella sp. LEGE 06141]|uniref:FAD-dependent oxidoreductase n=1 Tax=Oculatella sp. LEGE 06141 TaxID=1828648 RepID=UPI00187E2366|nr:NAD(P)/FAD-dependent oxidoreductase [Oculatella sp. LEGE 06141]